MKKPHSALVLLLLLGFGMSLAVPAQDLPDTAYDESETVPYESTPLFSIVLPLAAARTPQAVPKSLHSKLGAPSPFPSTSVGDTDANRATDTRISLALLCTLLC
jgi:hypothetical protein